MAKLSISLATGRALITAAGKWMLGCCCTPPPDCGCCVQTGTGPDVYECQDTGLPGTSGEDYCIGTLGGTPLKGVWLNRQFRCLPCEFEYESSSVVAPTCPYPAADDCGETCDDFDSAPATMLVAVNGPFNDEPSGPGENVGDYTDPCWFETFSLCVSKIQAVLAQGLILEQELGLSCPDVPEPVCETVHGCDYVAAESFAFCPSDGCADGPFGDPTPCEPGCSATFSITASLVPGCGYAFALSASIAPFSICRDQIVGGGATGPCDDVSISMTWGPGATGGGCMTGSNCFNELTPGAELDVDDEAGVLEGTPDVVVQIA